MRDAKDLLIMSLCEKLYICSRLLTCAAERLSWDSERVRELTSRLEEQLGEYHAVVQEE